MRGTPSPWEVLVEAVEDFKKLDPQHLLRTIIRDEEGDCPWCGTPLRMVETYGNLILPPSASTKQIWNGWDWPFDGIQQRVFVNVSTRQVMTDRPSSDLFHHSCIESLVEMIILEGMDPDSIEEHGCFINAGVMVQGDQLKHVLSRCPPVDPYGDAP